MRNILNKPHNAQLSAKLNYPNHSTFDKKFSVVAEGHVCFISRSEFLLRSLFWLRNSFLQILIEYFRSSAHFPKSWKSQFSQEEEVVLWRRSTMNYPLFYRSKLSSIGEETEMCQASQCRFLSFFSVSASSWVIGRVTTLFCRMFRVSNFGYVVAKILSWLSNYHIHHRHRRIIPKSPKFVLNDWNMIKVGNTGNVSFASLWLPTLRTLHTIGRNLVVPVKDFALKW